MKARLDGRTVRSRALDLRERGVSAAEAVAAVRDPHGWLTCRPPGPAHAHVGLLDGSDVDLERALASAARSRGLVPPRSADLEDVRERLAEPVPDATGLAEARERAARAEDAVRDLRERVERLGGKVAALRDVDAVSTSVREAHRAAAAELADAETERVAAAESLTRLRREARRVRDRRERRLALADRERRLSREARSALADAVRPSFERARRAVPSGAWRDALAVARVARMRAPVVLAGGPFERPARAAACLDAPVILAGPRV